MPPPRRPNGPVRFMVTCPARTGSTMLVSCLEGHGDICAHGEVFAPDGPLNFFGVRYDIDPPLEGALLRFRDHAPRRFLRRFVLEAGDRGAVGFKFKYEELFLDQWKGVRRAILRDRPLRVLHLTRDNLLDRYLSEHLAVQVHGFFEVRDPEELPPDAHVALSAEACQRDFERVLALQARVRRLLRHHPVLELTYEQLVHDREATLTKVTDFLGVESRPLRPETLKLQRQPLRAAITNYDDLTARFTGTPYERFLAGR